MTGVSTGSEVSMQRGSKLPAPSAKDINEAHRLAVSSAQSAVQHAIRCGQMLIRIAEDLGPRGGAQTWVEKRTDIAWSTAQRYMKAARMDAEGIAFESLRHCFPSGKQAKAEPTEKESVRPTAVGPNLKTAAEKAPFLASEGRSKALPEQAKNTRSAEPSDPAPDLDFSTYEPEDDEAFKANMENVIMADDKLAAILEQLKQAHRELQAVKSSRDHYLSESGAAVRAAKAKDREIEKLKKELEKAQQENEKLRERVAIMEAA